MAEIDKWNVRSMDDPCYSSLSPSLSSPALSTKNDTLLTSTTRETESDQFNRDVQVRTQGIEDSDRLGVQSHEARMQRTFSPFAALGLSFRSVVTTRTA